MDEATGYSKRQVNRAAQLLADVHAGRVAPDDADAINNAIEIVEWWRRLHSRPLSDVGAELHILAQSARATSFEVAQRLKRHITVIDKLGRFPSMELTRMEDIAGARVVLPNQAEVDILSAQIQSHPHWAVRRVREYIDGRDPGPKPDGYRAVHVIVDVADRFVEIQLRTARQDSWAQAVEDRTRTLGEGIKFGAGPADLRNYYRLWGEVLAAHDAGRSPDPRVVAALRQLDQSIDPDQGQKDQ